MGTCSTALGGDKRNYFLSDEVTEIQPDGHRVRVLRGNVRYSRLVLVNPQWQVVFVGSIKQSFFDL